MEELPEPSGRLPHDHAAVGDTFFDVPGEILSWRGSAAMVKTPDSYIPLSLLTLVDKAVYADCDAVDGLKDNLIQNPGRCSFRPQSLLCKVGDRNNCLMQAQVETLNTWFSAATDKQGRTAGFGYTVSDIYNDGEAGLNLLPD